MPRFVVLEHDSPRARHWDLMLERGDSLATWALSGRPDSAGPLAAEALADHRLMYLDYQGPVSGGRGSVLRWDQGAYDLEAESAEGLSVVLRGERLQGRALLRRRAGEPGTWEFSLLPADTGPTEGRPS